MNPKAIKLGVHVRYIHAADELLAKGVDLSDARGTVTGIVVPLEGEALADLEAIEREIRRSFKGAPAQERSLWSAHQRPVPRDQLTAILRDDAVPGCRYQFAAAGDLLPG